MNGKDIFLGLKYIGEDLIEEAEYGEFPSRSAEPAKRKPFRRPLLIAALIALMLTLVGCAVVYVMKMQDMKVGEFEATEPVFNEDQELQGYETVSLQVLTLAGLNGSPSYQAAREWVEFTQSYESDEGVWNDFMNFPEEYHAYQTYTQEMVDKVHEIADKYGLQLIGATVPIHAGDRFYQELNIDSLLNPGSRAAVVLGNVTAWESGCLMIGSFDMKMPNEEGQWPYPVLNSLYYSKKDCFSPMTLFIDDTANWTEWNYTTSAGYNVLLTRSGREGWIICDREDAVLSIRVLNTKDEAMTDRQFELIADEFDFSIRPQYQGEVTTAPGVDSTSKVQTQNGYTIELQSAVSDGQRTVLTLHITAPEDVSLTHLNVAGYEDVKPRITPVNGSFERRDGESPYGWSVGSSYTIDDGDGKENTVTFILEDLRECDGELAFPSGSQWSLYWEGLQATYFSNETRQVETAWEIEGTWIFDIAFTEGDFRAIELVQQPVTTNVSVGWNAKGEDVYDNVTIKSFILRSLSATVAFEGQNGDLTDYQNEKYVTVVMQDGTEIRLDPCNSYSFQAESPIDLDQVSHVRLADGTQLPVTS